MMKGFDIGIQKKKAKLFNEWEMFTSTNGESIESYYHRFLKLMNDFKRNKHFPEKIAKYTQLYDFLQYNQKDVDDLRAKQLAKTQHPLALMETSNNPYNFPMLPQDQPSPNPTTIMNMVLALMAKEFMLNYSTPTNNNQRISSNPRNMQIAQPSMNMGQDTQMHMVGGNGGNSLDIQNPGIQNVRNQNGLIVVQEIANQNPNGNVNLVAAQAEGNVTNDRSAEVIQICLCCVDSGCSKHMIGNLKLLINFVWKFMGTGSRQADKKPGASGRVFAITEGPAANTS
nr:hypothetical protein [Tanacetum cinerariifolium]